MFGPHAVTYAGKTASLPHTADLICCFISNLLLVVIKTFPPH